MKTKIFKSIVLSMVFVMLFSTSVLASSNISSESIEVKDKNIFELLNNSDYDVKVDEKDGVITYKTKDEELINILSSDNRVESSVKKNDKPKKIEIVYIPQNDTVDGVNNESEVTTDGLFSTDYEIRNVTYLGTGWYNEIDDLIQEYYVNGPDTFSVSQTEQHSAELSASVECEMELVNASVGFTIGSLYSITYTSNTPVAADENLHVQIYKTFTKKSFELWKSPLFSTSWNKLYTRYAYKPSGTYIKKEFY